MQRSRAGRRRVTWPVLGVAVALVAVLSACSAAPADPAVARPGSASHLRVRRSTDPSPRRSLPLQLVDESGRQVTLASLRGQVVVLADFLTLCQEICPFTSANLRIVADAVARAGLAAKVRILEVTVDPEGQPARLRAYQQLFGAQPNWSFLTGSEASVTALWKWLSVGYGPEPGLRAEEFKHG